ncbi:MAG: methylated-DNA--[protein]-cysteine S-methyltransferase [Gammaproteobacteria bacterium]|nr:methylated-DNA--[protein]-cysteine S-methyltransferase [Gammaproteobacteria bacterium]
MVYAAGYQSPFGPLTLFASDKGLVAVAFNDPSYAGRDIVTKECVLNPQAFPTGPIQQDESRFTSVFSELDSYFNGSLNSFETPLDYTHHGTAFQRRVWDALREIPYGSVVTYGELAEQIGNAKAARAVGLANNRNPLAILVPCHRVIGASGRLVGYAGGLPFKRSLLDLEGVTLGDDKGESSRDAILHAGTIAFSRSGYKGTTVDDIAKAAGVNKRMIYHHFGSKRGLYDEVFSIVEGGHKGTRTDVLQSSPNIAMRLKIYQLLETGTTSDVSLAADIERNEKRIAKLKSEGRMDSRYDTQLVARLLTIADQWKASSDKPHTRVAPVVNRLKKTL